jgi:hypothetical protein
MMSFVKPGLVLGFSFVEILNIKAYIFPIQGLTLYGAKIAIIV